MPIDPGTLTDRKPGRLPGEAAGANSRLPFTSFRVNGRYDFRRTDVMQLRAQQQKATRDRAQAGAWVIGRFVIVGTAVVLEAIAQEPTFWIDDARELTRDLDQFARWRTKQAAHQWFRDHHRTSCRPVNLEQLVRGRRRRVDQSATGQAHEDPH